MAAHSVFFLVATSVLAFATAFQTAPSVHINLHRQKGYSLLSSSSSEDTEDPLTSLITARLPTSVDDQVRQCVQSIQQADKGDVTRHSLRLLLPVIGATDLDDWPGGARQMMEAAAPLVDRIMTELGITQVQKVCLDESDGVYAYLGQAEQASDDCVFVLLPTADTIKVIQDQLEEQVGPKRNLAIVNPQWRRRSDFGGVFGNIDEKTAAYVEGYEPTFALTNLICEGESVRVLHTFGTDVWRVFVRKELDNGDIDWELLGTKPYVRTKPQNWNNLPENKRDGGSLFNYGQPSYQEIMEMLSNSANYTPKNPAERAAAAFTFIKDTL